MSKVQQFKNYITRIKLTIIIKLARWDIRPSMASLLRIKTTSGLMKPHVLFFLATTLQGGSQKLLLATKEPLSPVVFFLDHPVYLLVCKRTFYFVCQFSNHLADMALSIQRGLYSNIFFSC